MQRVDLAVEVVLDVGPERGLEVAGEVLEDAALAAARGEVDEADAGRIEVGQLVRIRLDAHPDDVHDARVASVWRTVKRMSWRTPEKVFRLDTDPLELHDLAPEEPATLDRLRTAVEQAYTTWNRRIGTAKLNRWLTGMVEAHPPPAPGGRRIKLRYMTQAKTRPPGFVVMCSHPDKMPESYKRYLVNGLRDDFDMPGTPIRLTLRGQGDKNPYKGRREKNAGALKKHLGKR